MAEHPSHKLPEDRRTRLFHLASAEFAEQGFARASLNRIIAQAEMSKSSFYHFFENKTDLFRQTLDNALAPMFEPLRTFDLTSLTAETYWPFLRAVAREQTQAANLSPEFAAIGQMFYRSLDTPEERELIADLMETVTGWLASLIRRGQVLGLVRTDLPDSLLFDALMGLGMAIDRWMLTNWNSLAPEARLALGEKTFDLFITMLKPDAPPTRGG
jgi:AcrR family transcriptional regulator